jgi:hypothetical protein
VIIRLTIEKPLPMQTLIQKLTFSGIMKAFGAIYVVLTVLQGYEPTWTTGLLNIPLYKDLDVALVAFFAKSVGSHGTPSAQITPEAAGQTAALTSIAAPMSFIGDAVIGTTNLYLAKPGDVTAVGSKVPDQRGDFVKISDGYYWRHTPISATGRIAAPMSFIGDAVIGTTNLYLAKPGDVTAVGSKVPDQRGDFVKISDGYYQKK